jgi:hypothetical protein
VKEILDKYFPYAETKDKMKAIEELSRDVQEVDEWRGDIDVRLQDYHEDAKE